MSPPNLMETPTDFQPDAGFDSNPSEKTKVKNRLKGPN